MIIINHHVPKSVTFTKISSDLLFLIFNKIMKTYGPRIILLSSMSPHLSSAVWWCRVRAGVTMRATITVTRATITVTSVSITIAITEQSPWRGWWL